MPIELAPDNDVPPQPRRVMLIDVDEFLRACEPPAESTDTDEWNPQSTGDG